MPPKRRRASKKRQSTDKPKRGRSSRGSQSDDDTKRARPPHPQKDPAQIFITSAIILGGGFVLLMIVNSLVGSHNKNQLKRYNEQNNTSEPTQTRPVEVEVEAAPVAEKKPPKPVYEKTARGLLALEKGNNRRLITTECSQCGKQNAKMKTFCSKCGAKFTWDAKLKCPMCCPPAELQIEVAGSKVGYCYECKGLGQDPDFNPTQRGSMGVGGSDSGDCKSCGATTKCKWCDEGWIDDPEFILMKR